MAEIWPVALQELLNQSGFKTTYGETTISSAVDIGVKKKRARYTRGIDQFGCSIDVELSDYQTFQTFYKTTLSNGVKTFLYNHPLTQVETEFRFVEAPGVSPIGGRWFRLEFVWEEMP